MLFYQACFGGELVFQTVGESPMSENMPQKMREYILHSRLSSDAIVIMGSDIASDDSLIKGNSVAMMLDCSSEQEVKQLYKKLSDGGVPGHLPELTHWGALFGDLKDRYGNQWLLHYQKG